MTDKTPACEYCNLWGPAVAFEDGAFTVLIGTHQPTGPGYAIVVPTRHVADLHGWPPEQSDTLLRNIRSVCRAVETAFDVSGTTVVVNVGPPGQRIEHLHAHVVPRRDGDGYPCSADEPITDEEVVRQAAVLGKALRIQQSD